MQLLENETIITSAKNNLLVLTNLRVIQHSKGGNAKFYKSIYLEDITSIAIDKKPLKLLLYLTLLALTNGIASMIGERIVAGVMNKPTGNLFILFAVASVFFYTLYSIFTLKFISIGTPSLRIELQIHAKDASEEFILAVEKAKLAVRRTTLLDPDNLTRTI